VKNHFHYFRVEQLNDVTMVTFTERNFRKQLALTEMKTELVKYGQAEQPGRLLINFANVEHFSTELIGTMLSVKKLLGDEGTVKLCCLEPVHREIFQVLNLDGTVFQIFDTLDDALDSF
jgi:anti-anti-sigma regulatory factor